MLKQLTKKENLDDFIKEGNVLVDFFATWCGPCQMLAPVLEELAQEENITIIEIDVDQHEQLAQTYGVMSVPTLLFYRQGNLITRKIGYMPKEQIKKTFEN